MDETPGLTPMECLGGPYDGEIREAGAAPHDLYLPSRRQPPTAGLLHQYVAMRHGDDWALCYAGTV